MKTDIQFASSETIAEIQFERLRNLLSYLSDKSPYYKSHFSKNNMRVEDIIDWNTFRKIPTVSKTDLQKEGKNFWCVDASKIVEYSSTSGTEGRAITVPLTENDLIRLGTNEMNSFKISGGDFNEIYQLTTTIDRRFMAGRAYMEGARMLGAGMVRVGPGLPEMQWDTIMDLGVTSLIVVPSFLLKMIEYAEVNGINYNQSSVKTAICIGEPIRNADFTLNVIGQRIQEKWNINLHATYASTEMATAFTECSAGQGGHIQADLIVVEILDDHGNELSPGEPGELTITTLGIEGMPLLRFRTGDICTKHIDKCRCGRTTFRLGPLIGRKNQMIKFKGTTCYAPAIFDLLDGVSAINNYQIVVSHDEFHHDHVLIRYASDAKIDPKLLAEKFQSKLRFLPDLARMDSDELHQLVYPRASRKPMKFVDHRIV